MKRMAVISAGFVPVPAVDGGAGEVLTTYLIEGNEKKNDFFMDIYTIASPKLDTIQYKNAEIIQIHINKWNWFSCKARNAFLKLFRRRYRFIPYNRALLKAFRDNYDIILIENNMQVYEDIYKHARSGTDNMIYHMHNDIDGTTKPEYLCEFIAKTAKLILPVSAYLKRHFNEVAPNAKMEVLYNCIDTDIFRYDESAVRKNSDYTFLYAGRICKEKGVLELIQAFQKILEEYSKVRLKVVGSSWYNVINEDTYFKIIREETSEISEFIEFTGYVDLEKMPKIYEEADCVIIPTLCEEAFGMVALEAMVMKKNIIATSVGGMKEILEDTEAILIEQDKNIIANLYESMKQCIEKDSGCICDYEVEQFDKRYYYDNFINLVRKADE